MKIHICTLAALVASLAIACGNQVTYTGGGGGGVGGHTTTSSSSSSSSSGVVPPQCQVPAAAPPPYPINFDLINNGPGTLYLLATCAPVYTITSCADGYSQELATTADCTVDCQAEPDQCVLCGACPHYGMPVGEGEVLAQPWSGNTYTFGQNAVGCECSNTFTAPAGKYRISVPVYLSEQDAMNGTPSWVIEQDFELPTTSGPVSVWLQAAYDNGQ